MERPAHTALFQSIWNHPAEENGQNVNLGSWGGGSFCGLPSPLPLLVAAIIRAPANYRVVHLVILIGDKDRPDQRAEPAWQSHHKAIALS